MSATAWRTTAQYFGATFLESGWWRLQARVGYIPIEKGYAVELQAGPIENPTIIYPIGFYHRWVQAAGARSHAPTLFTSIYLYKFLPVKKLRDPFFKSDHVSMHAPSTPRPTSIA